MSLNDLQRLPPGVMILVAVMFWPAIWAAAGMAVALVTDLNRQTKEKARAPREASPIRGR